MPSSDSSWMNVLCCVRTGPASPGANSGHAIMKAPAPTPVSGRSLAMLRPVRQASIRPRAETSSP